MKNYSHEADNSAENKNYYNIKVITVNRIVTLNRVELFSAEVTSVIRLEKVIWSTKYYLDLIFLRSVGYSKRVQKSSYCTLQLLPATWVSFHHPYPHHISTSHYIPYSLSPKIIYNINIIIN